MSGMGNCLDNLPMENFFGLLKQELYNGENFHSYEALEEAIKQYVQYYNENRMKEKLGVDESRWVSNDAEQIVCLMII